MGLFSRGKGQVPISDESIYGSIYITFAQALEFGRESPASEYIGKYLELFSSILFKNRSTGLISDFTIDLLKHSQLKLNLNLPSVDRFALANFDSVKYLMQGMHIATALNPWRENYLITNDDQVEIFRNLSQLCEQMGMDENDDETLGLLFLTSLYYVTLLKDAQQIDPSREKKRDLGTFFATDLINLWLLAKTP